ncbi:hypothetical protein L6274_05820 [Candidatus Parcubacteria bacterium]|nr:hypothetical protein [Candidatus Parcubacteria bacterium]
MNKYSSEFEQLKQEFGKYGSWAIWDEDGSITEKIKKDNFQTLIKPDAIFLGLNATIKLTNDWINYHSECQEFKKKKWGQEFIKNLADLIMSDEFSALRGSYMTDIVKDVDLPESSKVIKELKSNPEILSRSKNIFEKELNLLLKISLTDKFRIICIGRDTFDILCRDWDIPTKRISNKMRFASIEKYNRSFDILESYHYSYRKKENIKQDLKEIIKKC